MRRSEIGSVVGREDGGDYRPAELTVRRHLLQATAIHLSRYRWT
jgi:hypothetical protein